MYSSPRPDTPYVVFSPKVNDEYFDGNGRQMGSALQASLNVVRVTRPATPFTAAAEVEIDGGHTARRARQYALGLGLASQLPSQHVNGGEQSRNSSGNLSSRRPSLRIVQMPVLDLIEPSLSSGRSNSSGSTSSSKGESDATLTALRSLSLSSIRGPGRARFEVEQDDERGEDDTPRVGSFAAAIRNSQRKATPYPCDKGAYFGDEQEDALAEGHSDEQEDWSQDHLDGETKQPAAKET